MASSLRLMRLLTNETTPQALADIAQRHYQKNGRTDVPSLVNDLEKCYKKIVRHSDREKTVGFCCQNIRSLGLSTESEKDIQRLCLKILVLPKTPHAYFVGLRDVDKVLDQLTDCFPEGYIDYEHLEDLSRRANKRLAPLLAIIDLIPKPARTFQFMQRIADMLGKLGENNTRVREIEANLLTSLEKCSSESRLSVIENLIKLFPPKKFKKYCGSRVGQLVEQLASCCEKRYERVALEAQKYYPLFNSIQEIVDLIRALKKLPKDRFETTTSLSLLLIESMKSAKDASGLIAILKALPDKDLHEQAARESLVLSCSLKAYSHSYFIEHLRKIPKEYRLKIIQLLSDLHVQGIKTKNYQELLPPLLALVETGATKIPDNILKFVASLPKRLKMAGFVAIISIDEWNRDDVIKKTLSLLKPSADNSEILEEHIRCLDKLEKTDRDHCFPEIAALITGFKSSPPEVLSKIYAFGLSERAEVLKLLAKRNKKLSPYPLSYVLITLALIKPQERSACLKNIECLFENRVGLLRLIHNVLLEIDSSSRAKAIQEVQPYLKSSQDAAARALLLLACTRSNWKKRLHSLIHSGDQKLFPLSLMSVFMPTEHQRDFFKRLTRNVEEGSITNQQFLEFLCTIPKRDRSFTLSFAAYQLFLLYPSLIFQEEDYLESFLLFLPIDHYEEMRDYLKNPPSILYNNFMTNLCASPICAQIPNYLRQIQDKLHSCDKFEIADTIIRDFREFRVSFEDPLFKEASLVVSKAKAKFIEGYYRYYEKTLKANQSQPKVQIALDSEPFKNQQIRWNLTHLQVNSHLPYTRGDLKKEVPTNHQDLGSLLFGSKQFEFGKRDRYSWDTFMSPDSIIPGLINVQGAAQQPVSNSRYHLHYFLADLLETSTEERTLRVNNLPHGDFHNSAQMLAIASWYFTLPVYKRVHLTNPNCPDFVSECFKNSIQKVLYGGFINEKFQKEIAKGKEFYFRTQVFITLNRLSKHVGYRHLTAYHEIYEFSKAVEKTPIELLIRTFFRYTTPTQAIQQIILDSQDLCKGNHLPQIFRLLDSHETDQSKLLQRYFDETDSKIALNELGALKILENMGYVEVTEPSLNSR